MLTYISSLHSHAPEPDLDCAVLVAFFPLSQGRGPERGLPDHGPATPGDISAAAGDGETPGTCYSKIRLYRTLVKPAAC